MGARANIILRFTPDSRQPEATSDIFIYSHWDGEYMAIKAKQALARRQRWSNDSYLSRIIINEVIHDSFGDETGYGVSPFETDNEYPFIVVDHAAQTVRIGEGKTYTFSEYIAAPDEELTALMNEGY